MSGPRVVALLLATLLLAGCAAQDEVPTATLQDDLAPMMEEVPVGDALARALLDTTIAVHGGDALDRARMAFVFRGTPFVLTRDAGRFVYERTRTDEAGLPVRDVLDNDGLRREVSGTAVPMDDRETRRTETDVNSVAYFALLPAPLTDPAVTPRYLGQDVIAGEPYERVEVTFAQDGGGRDWQDRYVYWLHAETRTMDYLAYSYELAPDADGPNDTGHRFRIATNARTVGGVRVQDYRNHTADSIEALDDYAALVGTERLRRVSDVVLDSVTVELLR
ncbi:MAG: DUF6503 family protein [Bacteroidota bacterium]